MTPFELARAAFPARGGALLDTGEPTVRPIAGGTALMLMMKAGVFRPARLVSLRAVEERYSRSQRTGRRAADRRHDDAVRAGALASWCASKLPGHHPDAAHAVEHPRAQRRDRRRHLAHADPHMDLPPVLIALGARVVHRGCRASATIPVADCIAGYYETVLDGTS